jgi:uncharacterized protein (TIGR02147 family)
MNLSSLNIFDYMSYRTYLRDIYLHQKKSDKKFSLQYFANKMGFSSRGNLKMVMDGKSNISPAAINRLNKLFGHDKSECECFRAMVMYEQAKNDEERLIFFDRMTASKPRISMTALERDRNEVILDKLYLILREAVEHPLFRDDPEWLATRLAFQESPKKIRHVIDTLLRLGLIQSGTDGRLRQVDTVIATPPTIGIAETVRYHQQILALAYKMLLKQPERFLELATMTIPIPTDLLDEVHRKITVFREELLQFVNSASRDYNEVFLFNVQIFPVTNFRGAKTSKSGNN